MSSTGFSLAFGPQAMVLVCGADSLAGDRLGGMNLSLRSYRVGPLFFINLYAKFCKVYYVELFEIFLQPRTFEIVG